MTNKELLISRINLLSEKEISSLLEAVFFMTEQNNAYSASHVGKVLFLTYTREKNRTVSFSENYADMVQKQKKWAFPMNQTYEGLSEEDKQKFCMDMFAKKDFFEDSCKMIMDVFEHASAVPKEGANK